jgi:hypothetical protein
MKKKLQAVHIPETLFYETLAQTPLDGKHPLEPMLSYAEKHSVPIAVIEDKNVSTVPEVHLCDTDFFQCLEGSVEFITGGELQGGYFEKDAQGGGNNAEIRGASIIGGTQVTLTRGDIIWIPAGVPHVHQSAGVARLLIVKVPANIVNKDDVACLWR